MTPALGGMSLNATVLLSGVVGVTGVGKVPVLPVPNAKLNSDNELAVTLLATATWAPWRLASVISEVSGGCSVLTTKTR